MGIAASWIPVSEKPQSWVRQLAWQCVDCVPFARFSTWTTYSTLSKPCLMILLPCIGGQKAGKKHPLSFELGDIVW